MVSTSPASTVAFDLELIRKYDRPAPRYTSYPPATQLRPFSAADFQAALLAVPQVAAPLSLYCHIPFCRSACYFCGCNVIITRDPSVAEGYLDYLMREIAQTGGHLAPTTPVVQMHWGGGTPNYLTPTQIERLFGAFRKQFRFADDAELSIEINPATLNRETAFFLRQLGFNRISFGIQDFDPVVQRAVNRVQPERHLRAVMQWLREAGFESINVDLIYGLPFQSLDSFEQTVRKTLELAPDRIAVFNFAYVPALKPLQNRIPEQALPSAPQKLEILRSTVQTLVDEGYVYIGMDHFARPDDELAIAQRERTLKRNFQGYTTRAEAELLAFGTSSISMFGNCYTQNHKELEAYCQAVAAGLPPVERGIRLSADDRLRRAVIMDLMSHFALAKADIEAEFQICFDTYFAHELQALAPLAADGLVRLSDRCIEVSETGRLLVRNIALVFDLYSRSACHQPLSQTI